jgi:uncharacterized protein (TIGR02453 family)
MSATPRFSKASLEFIEKASRQKKKEWLEKNRAEYERVLVEPMRAVMDYASKMLKPEAPGYRFPNRNTARITRGADNAALYGPFRDWIGTSISRDSGSRYEGCPNLYVSIANGHEEILSAGGLYMPSADQTKHIRSWIDKDPSKLEELVEDKNFRKIYKELGQERKLKTKPRDYPLDHPKIEWLKLSGFYVWRPFTKKQLFSKEFADLLVQDWTQVLRLNRVLDEYTTTWPKAQAIDVLPLAKPFQDDWED